MKKKHTFKNFLNFYLNFLKRFIICPEINRFIIVYNLKTNILIL